MRELLFGLILGLLLPLGSLLLAARPVEGRPVVAVFAPGSDAARMIGAVAVAGGAITALSQDRPLSVSISDVPGYAGRLYGAGAWLVLDASAARFCANLVGFTGGGK